MSDYLPLAKVYANKGAKNVQRTPFSHNIIIEHGLVVNQADIVGLDRDYRKPKNISHFVKQNVLILRTDSICENRILAQYQLIVQKDDCSDCQIVKDLSTHLTQPIPQREIGL